MPPVTALAARRANRRWRRDAAVAPRVDVIPGSRRSVQPAFNLALVCSVPLRAIAGSRSYQLFASFLGLPAFSLPVMSSGGLPVGAQLIGHAGKDGELCALACGLMALSEV
jgi:Asp-tRNA(Asn)/Glu-tRNA(Gln) amidotransferase A subunit family amidase